MENKTTFSETTIKHLAQRQGFTFRVAVADDVVGIPLERHAGTSPLQPDVENVVQEKVGQKRADDPSLWRSTIPLHKTAILQHRRSRQPALDVEQHPWARRVLAHSPQEQLMIDAVEEPLMSMSTTQSYRQQR